MAFYNPNTTPATPQRVEAAVTPWHTLPRNLRREYVTDETWQQFARHCDTEGPGIVGACLDLAASFTMMVNLVVQERTPQGWETTTDDPLLTAILNAWHGGDIDQQALLAQLVRTSECVGEGYLLMHNRPGDGRMWWQLAQTINMTDNRDGTFTYLERPGLRQGDPGHWQMANRWAFHFHNPDPTWAGQPWSQLRRGLPIIKQYKLAMRNLGRGLESQLISNGVMWAKMAAAETGWRDDFKAWSYEALTNDQGVEAVLPFLMDGVEDLQWSPIGRTDYGEQIETMDAFLVAFAQSLDWPTKLVTEGPAQGKYSNSLLEGDHVRTAVMYPKLAHAASVVTETHLRPLLRGLPNTKGYKPGSYRIWFDDSALSVQPDTTEDVKWAWQQGLITPDAAADKLNIDPGQRLQRPSGVSAYEHWAISTGSAFQRPEPAPPLEQFAGTQPTPEIEDPAGFLQLPAGPDVIEAEAELKATWPADWDELVPTP